MGRSKQKKRDEDQSHPPCHYLIDIQVEVVSSLDLEYHLEWKWYLE